MKTRIVLGMGVFAVGAGLVLGQEAVPAFDAAEVQASAKTPNPTMRGGQIRGGRYGVRWATMVDLIGMAYGVDGDKVVGGPSWLDFNRFDITAKAPVATTQETAKLMLRTLLTDRFQLVVHPEQKAMPALVLSVGKGGKPKLKESTGGGPPACNGVPQTSTPGVPGYNVIACHNMSIEEFGQSLRGYAGNYISNPVVNKTGLEGGWDFEIKWTGRGQLAAAGADGISIFDALDKLGLKLEPQSVPQPVLRVESALEKPTPNAGDISAKLPPAPVDEFEVAEIKPSMPGGPEQQGRIQNGRIDLHGWTLKDLINQAWEINGDDLLVDVPKFLDVERWDVVAKAPIEVANQKEADIGTLELMLRALLAERFHLKTHTEDRAISAYTLTAVKPKMAKADPTNRAGCKDGPGLDGKDPRIANPVLNRLISCQNVTMAQFGERLSDLANGYVHVPALDATGLDGAYDFSVNFSGAGVLRGAGAQGGADPNGALSLPDAISKQLGLKLELGKRPVPVLVIDAVEPKPTEN